MAVSLADFFRSSRDDSSWPRRHPVVFGILTSLLALGIELFIDRTTAEPIFPFLPGFAAILVCAVLGGSESSLSSTVLLTAWAVVDLRFLEHRSVLNTAVRSLLFAAEGAALTLGTARLQRSVRQAARAEAWHRKLVETASEAIWVLDNDGKIVWANARIANLLGIPADALAGRTAEEFFFPVDLSAERIRRQNLRNGRTEQFDRRMRRSDGTELWVLACCNLVTLETGDLTGSLAMMTDITERKTAEHALRRSEERFRTLFENVLEGVYQSTPEGRILAANPMLLKMLGIGKVRDLDDVNIASDLYVDRELRRRLLEQLEREGGFQNVEYELRRRDGGIITVLENARVVRDDSGQILYYEGTLTDITQRKRMEEQLRQAQKVEALGRLAGGIAHDFSNALTIIAGYGELALGELSQGHPARENVEHVMQSVESAVSLTRQLIAFSHRQTGGQGGTDLNRAVRHCEGALQRFLMEHDRARGEIHLAVSCPKDPLLVYAGKDQIDQIVLSLANSLCESMPAMRNLTIGLESIALDAEFCRRCSGTPAGPCAVLSVFNPEVELRPVRLRLADSRFAPAHPAESAALGLSAVHALVAQNEGFLSIARVSGLPCAFQVFLPCAPIPDAGQNPASGSPAEERQSGETILLVEDEPLIRELSRDMLERQGYRVILAEDASEAERIGAGAVSFDLLITDTVTPTLSGAELARRLRVSHPRLKVLFIQGYADEGQPLEIGIPGASFLQKPFSADSLGRKIRKVLNRT
jgi:PAS domain S-box-containing protein